MRETFLAIINPHAGNGRCGKRAPQELAALSERGLRIEQVHTRGPGDATRLAAEASARGQRHFIAVGGDGTAYEVLNGLSEVLDAPEPERAHLGFLPLGTGNSFLRDFGPDSLTLAREALLTGRSRACDVLRLQHDTGTLHYLNLLSLGFVAQICAITNRHFKVLGAGGYALGVVSALAGLSSRPLRMRVDDQTDVTEPMVFVSVCNSRFTGGQMMMAPAADTADGQADVVVCGPMNRRTLLATFPKIFAGTHVQHPLIHASRARSLEFLQPEPCDIMIDGEVVRHTPRRIDVRAAAIQVFV